MGLLQFVIFGLEKGSYIAIATIGFSLIYGIVDMINFAYGEYMTFGGYIAVVMPIALAALGLGSSLNVWVTLAVVFVVSAGAGWLVSRVTFTPIHNYGPIPLLLTSIGLGVALRNVYRFAFGIERKFVTFTYFVVPEGPFRVTSGPFDFFVTRQMVVVIGISVATLAGIHLLLTRTDLGVAMRATASNEDLAQLSGIRSYNIRQYTWVLASGLAGVSGLLIGALNEVSPILGLEFILVILASAILGGVGSVYGGFAGAYLIGLTIAFAAAGFRPVLELLPVVGELLVPWGEAIAPLSRQVSFFVLIVVLLLKPSGIAGTEVET
jgi:branched-subunit amino acid ABC-type transport system permease component